MGPAASPSVPDLADAWWAESERFEFDNDDFWTAECDLPPTSRTSLKLVKSVNQPENDGHEEEQIQRRTDHRVPAAG